MYKNRYAVHHENLKFYLEHGMVLKKVREAVLHTGKACIQPFIDICTEARKVAMNDFATVILVNLWKMPGIGVQ